MSPAPSTSSSDLAHEAEVQTQAEIAAEVAAAEAPAPEAAPEAPEVAKVTLKPTAAVESYPLSVSAVGVEDELVFETADATVEVGPEVAEQVKYLPTVEVAA